MSRALKFLMFIYFVVFFTTGAFMVLIVNADEASAPWITLLVRNHGIVFVWHLTCWMVMGMFSNYYWDLFNMGKGLESVQVERIILPLPGQSLPTDTTRQPAPPSVDGWRSLSRDDIRASPPTPDGGGDDARPL